MRVFCVKESDGWYVYAADSISTVTYCGPVSKDRSINLAQESSHNDEIIEEINEMLNAH